MELLLLSLPWLLVGLYMVVLVRPPPDLPDVPPRRPVTPASVSIVVPARDEEENLPSLLESLRTQEYPDFEVLVVDDQSRDRTSAIVTACTAGNARSLRLISGEPPPHGWFGKPWACAQGAREATGDLLLFTDADTVHDPSLLSRAVAGLESEEADVLTLIGRQVMGSFWERMLQPQFFMLLAARFPRVGVPRSPRRWRDAIANGQYLLFRKETYEAVGGHEAVRGEVVEDMRLAQLLVRKGHRLVVREGRGLRTRMYRSLPGLVSGWSKNLATGALQATGGCLRPLILPLSFIIASLLWLLPPAVLTWAVFSGSGGLPLLFGGLTTGFGILYWGSATGIMGGNPAYGLLFPMGSFVAAYIFLLSWIRGGRIHWRGRSYFMAPEARRGVTRGSKAGK